MARKPAELAVNRHDILLAAANVFRHKSFHDAKMADIAAEVNLTAGSLYHHFPDGKRQILHEVLCDGLDMVTAEVRAIAEDTTLSADEKLTKAITAHVLALTHNVSVAAALVFETRNILDDTTDARENYVQRRDMFENLYRQIVEEGIAAGVFRRVDVPIFTKALLGSHNWIGVWYREGGRLTGEELAHEMVDIYLHTLLARRD